MLTNIYNGRILLPDGRWLNGGSVVVDGSRIAEISENSRIVENADRIIDAGGGYVMPGAIDMHFHGGGGRDFMEADREAFKTVVDVHRRHGTTSLFPSVASASNAEMRAAAAICTEMMADPYTGVLGLHFEGPYFQPSMAGGQLAPNIRLPQPEEYESIIRDFPCVRRWDAAPELLGGLAFGRFMSENGVVAGIAHTVAVYDDIAAAYANGYTLATHFYNAMTTIHKKGIYKEEGTVESILLFDGIDVELIADGVHVPPALMRLAYKVKGWERTALVTDALFLTGFSGESSFDPRVIVENGACMLRDGSALAGSCATMDRLIRTTVKSAGIPLADAARMASAVPARIMGVDDRKGILSPGKDADIIIMDEDLTLTYVMALGREIPPQCKQP